jgi:putative FmdB family regulatory protein
MPIYEYSPTSGPCDQCNGLFEVFQSMAEDKLTACPGCGKACERRISLVAISSGRYSTSDAAVKRSGMTKYKKQADGTYERTVGTGGPETLVR